MAIRSPMFRENSLHTYKTPASSRTTGTTSSTSSAAISASRSRHTEPAAATPVTDDYVQLVTIDDGRVNAVRNYCWDPKPCANSSRIHRRP